MYGLMRRKCVSRTILECILSMMGALESTYVKEYGKSVVLSNSLNSYRAGACSHDTKYIFFSS